MSCVAFDGSMVMPVGLPPPDKIVQRAIVGVLNAIYETDFVGFSYGFRPGRSQHHALDALATAIRNKKVKWVLDADIRGFFDAIDHGWMVKFVARLEEAIPSGLSLLWNWFESRSSKVLAFSASKAAGTLPSTLRGLISPSHWGTVVVDPISTPR